MPGVRPPEGFDRAPLELQTIEAGRRFGRIYAEHHPDPLGFGLGPSRFSDPRRRVDASRFGVLYLGATLKVCFLEAVLRDRRDGVVGDLPLAERQLTSRLFTEVEVAAPLRVVDLRGDAPVRMGVPSDVARASRHTLGRAWSVAFHDHPAAPDGLLYPSRLNGEENLAVYGRAVGKLRAVRLRRLIAVSELAPLLAELRVALVGPDEGAPATD